MSEIPTEKTVPQLEKELREARAQISYLEWRERILRRQFAFYVEHGKQPWEKDAELPKL